MRAIRATFAALLIGVLSAPELGAGAARVTLKSGERVIGEISARSDDETLVLDSALLGEVAIPRASIAAMESGDPPDRAASASTAAEKEPKRAKGPDPVGLLSAANLADTPLGATTPESWSGHLRVGLNLSDGDRKWAQTFMRGRLRVDPEGSPNHYRLEGAYTFRENERPDGRTFKTTDKYDGTFLYRRSVSENWFVQNDLGVRADQIKGIDLEAQEQVGVGRRFAPADSVDFLLGAGGGAEYLEANFDPGMDGQIAPVVSAFQEFAWRPTRRTRLTQEFAYNTNATNADQYTFTFDASLRYRLTRMLGVELSYNREFDNAIDQRQEEEDILWRNALIVYF